MSAAIWWVRHGPTHAKSMVGWSDLPADLSDTAAVARLAAHLPAGAPVVSSDLSRAVATADAIACGRPRLPNDPALREMHFGAWELQSAAELEASDPARARAFWDDPTAVRPPGGESWAELCARVDAAADRLTARGGAVIAVAHFGAILSQVQRAEGTEGPDAFAQRIDTLSVTRLTWDGRAWQAGPINHRP
ncbi:histidine phosphatase family protein [Rhodobacteraceae bacterium CCMM004]|nr:histidine phosphatase family protein [Rhodobacteraceae bacterium CCMM004]